MTIFKYIYIYTVPLHSRYYPMKSPAPTAPVSLAQTGSPLPLKEGLGPKLLSGYPNILKHKAPAVRRAFGHPLGL